MLKEHLDRDMGRKGIEIYGQLQEDTISVDRVGMGESVQSAQFHTDSMNLLEAI